MHESRFHPSGEVRSQGGVYRRRRRPRALVAGALLLCVSSCASLSNFNTFSPQQDVELGAQAYGEILGPEKIITSGPQVQMIEGMTQRLVQAARFEYPELVDMFQWEVRLIDNKQTVNAFCLPGGKMAVYSGILDVAETEGGLAVVMGHEISHALERHGTEAMTRQMGVAVLIQIALGDATAQQVATLAANLGQLSFGRNAEYEADRIGLRIMARAGYDPRQATEFWTRMAALGGSAPPEWLSTHPSNENRIQQLQELMPEALVIYHEVGGQP